MDLTPLKQFFQNQAERRHVEVALLYGSQAGGFPRPDSDIDISVAFEDKPDDNTAYGRLTDMSPSSAI